MMHLRLYAACLMHTGRPRQQSIVTISCSPYTQCPACTSCLELCVIGSK